VIAKTIAIPLTTSSSAAPPLGAMWRIRSDIEDCCIERRLFVLLAGNLIFTEETFNFVCPTRQT
jgi:hypothetical protein